MEEQHFPNLLKEETSEVCPDVRSWASCSGVFCESLCLSNDLVSDFASVRMQKSFLAYPSWYWPLLTPNGAEKNCASRTNAEAKKN